MKRTIYTILLMISLTACYRVKLLNIVHTGGASNVTSNAARMNGVIISQLGTVVNHGHCYSTSPTPTLSDHRTQLGSKEKASNFSSVLHPLLPNVKYYVRGYMIIGSEVIYGKETTFDTGPPGDDPHVESMGVSVLTSSTAEARGLLKHPGNTTIQYYGHCWSLEPSPTTDMPTVIKQSGSPPGEFTSTISGLTPATTYYIRAFVITETGVSFYGSENVFTMAKPKP
jgi:hypothetical protein